MKPHLHGSHRSTHWLAPLPLRVRAHRGTTHRTLRLISVKYSGQTDTTHTRYLLDTCLILFRSCTRLLRCKAGLGCFWTTTWRRQGTGNVDEGNVLDCILFIGDHHLCTLLPSEVTYRYDRFHQNCCEL